jgi:hypothetical protein
MFVKEFTTTISKAFIIVFKNKRYFLSAGVVSVIAYLLIILIQKSEFVAFVLSSGLFTATVKFKLLVSSFFSIDTNFTSPFSFWMVILLVVITGINVAMLTYLLRRQATARREAGASIFGVIAGIFGIGCAACGSVLLTTILGIGITGSIISFLPLNGVEFLIIALSLLIYSTYFVSKKIINPMVCKVVRRAIDIE